MTIDNLIDSYADAVEALFKEREKLRRSKVRLAALEEKVSEFSAQVKRLEVQDLLKLRRLFTDPRPAVRMRAAVHLEDHIPDEVMPIFQELLAHTGQIAAIAIACIKRMNGEGYFADRQTP